MVKLYWNCCWNVAQSWFFKSNMAIKALQYLPIFHMVGNWMGNCNYRRPNMAMANSNGTESGHLKDVNMMFQ